MERWTPVTRQGFCLFIKRTVDPIGLNRMAPAYQYDAIANYQDIVAGKSHGYFWAFRTYK